jgi:uncharacterized caspase-like protein
MLLWSAVATVHPSAFGDGLPPTRRWAVVIGVDRYDDPAIPRLKYCASDAKLLADTLVKDCGYAPERVLLLTNDAKSAELQPVGGNLRKELTSRLAKVAQNDTVLVYFSGHGFLDDQGQGYLAPRDCRVADLGKTGLKTDDLRAMLQACRADNKVLLLDCCHAGGARGEGGAAAPSSQELGSALQTARRLVVLASCRKNERSHEWDERKHGLFTYFVAEGLKGAADYDQDRTVNSDELYRYLYEEVSTAARKELNVRQTPVRMIGDDATGIVTLARLTGRPAALNRPAEGNPEPAPEGESTVRIEFLGSLEGAKGPAVFSPDGTVLATEGVNLWDARTREAIAVLKPSRFDGDSAARVPIGFALDGKSLIATPGSFKPAAVLELWDVASRKSVVGRGFVADVGNDEYTFPTFCPDGRVVYKRMYYDRAKTDTQYYVMLWDIKAGKEKVFLRGPSLERIHALAVSPTGKVLAAGDNQGNIVIYELATGKELVTIAAHASLIWKLMFSPRGDVLASNAMGDRPIKLWNPATGQKLHTLEMEREGVYQNVAFHPSGKFIATSSGPIFKPETGSLVKPIFRDTSTGKPLPIDDIDAIDPLAFSLDGSTLAATTNSGIGLWSVHVDGK